ncbi:MAG: TIGR00300 family protein [Planctomycetales bacterium]|nr:TIGR00300 family protein [Planctomycetales bacterium]
MMPTEKNPGFVEEVEVAGHIIDSLILPKVLDTITSAGGSFRIKSITIGQGRSDPSRALIEVQAESESSLQEILGAISDHGAVPVHSVDCQVELVSQPGVLPEGFYSSTNQRTEVRLAAQWIEVADQEMDCGIVVLDGAARCVPMAEAKPGDPVVIGHSGVRVFPPDRGEDAKHAFAFMNSPVSTEKPKAAQVRRIAQLLHENRNGARRTLVVGGPAIVHTGSGPLLSQLIREGFVHKLFAGNALATHDIEQAMFGTSLGVHLHDASLAEAGHEHHLRAINRVRRAGSIAAAVEQGMLTSGVMHDCVQHNVEFLLAGSIRDDGPLPDVITDVLEAQRQMRAAIRDVTFCLMIATTLHSIAVGNLLPAWVKVVCVDINPSTVIKLSDRGSFQTVGLVTDVEPFLRSLVSEVLK